MSVVHTHIVFFNVFCCNTQFTRATPTIRCSLKDTEHYSNLYIFLLLHKKFVWFFLWVCPVKSFPWVVEVSDRIGILYLCSNNADWLYSCDQRVEREKRYCRGIVHKKKKKWLRNFYHFSIIWFCFTFMQDIISM